MEIAFGTREIRSICSSASTAENALGIGLANSLRRILADLRAARSLSEFGLLYGLEIQSEMVQLPIGEGMKLVLTVGHRIVPLKDGALDVDKVHRVMVVSLGERM